MSTDFFRELFTHMEWADALVWKAVRSLDRVGLDPKLRDGLFHVCATQHAFLNVWTDKPLAPPSPSEFVTLADLQAWGTGYYPAVHAFLNETLDSSLGESTPLPWTSDFEEWLGPEAATPTLGETVFQVVAHSTYHRGQINRRIRELGGEPPFCDFIAWVWLSKPRASGSDRPALGGP